MGTSVSPCLPFFRLVYVRHAVAVVVGVPVVRGLHSSTSQFNLSRVWHKIHPNPPLMPPNTP